MVTTPSETLNQKAADTYQKDERAVLTNRNADNSRRPWKTGVVRQEPPLFAIRLVPLDESLRILFDRVAILHPKRREQGVASGLRPRPTSSSFLLG